MSYQITLYILPIILTKKKEITVAYVKINIMIRLTFSNIFCMFLLDFFFGGGRYYNPIFLDFTSLYICGFITYIHFKETPC